MRTQHLRGTTEQLNRLSLPAGRIALNTDNGNIRFWDGETLGGYEVETQQAYEPPPTPPGPTELIAGNYSTGFYGEVPPAEFISYGELSTLVGLSAGTLHNDGESLWLKFGMGNRPCYVAKKTIRHSISHDQLAGADLVRGNRSVVIGRITYVVRLLTGLVNSYQYIAGGEWNRFLYPVHQSDPNSQGWGVGYSSSDLGFDCGSWVQETSPDWSDLRVHRGLSSVGYLSASSSGSTHSTYGWRPILIPEL